MNKSSALALRSDADTLLDLLLVEQNKDDAGDRRIAPFWRNVRAGVFVTMYRQLPPSSRNIYCCMSNGDYWPRNSLRTNIDESTHICKTRDDRRLRGGPPIAYEIALFAPRLLWLPLGPPSEAASKMRREKQRAFLFQLGEGGDERAVYLPEVWDERPDWSATDLLVSLADKAANDRRRRASSAGGEVGRVFEIPCFVVGDRAIGIKRHDRGFFASLILQRAYSFYNRFRSGDQLAYLVDKKKKNKEVISYDNSGAQVRTLADAAAFFKLSRLLLVNEDRHDAANAAAIAIVDRALADTCTDNDGHRDDAKAACIAARVMLLIDTGRGAQIAMADIDALVRAYPDPDVAFTNPQIVLALCRARPYLPTTERRERVGKVVRHFADNDTTTDGVKDDDALSQYGAFAANWILQALAACCNEEEEEHDASKTMAKRRRQRRQQRLVRVCEQAIDRAASVTEQACAAHGLLVTALGWPTATTYDNDSFFRSYDWLAESWARLQSEWSAEASGGFRYHIDQPWYRTDVTSHIVEVCLLLHAETRLNDDNNGGDNGDAAHDETTDHARRLRRIGL